MKLSKETRAIADGRVAATNKQTGQVVHETLVHNEEVFDMDLGDGGAKICNTRGFKKWASNRDRGLTVESTVTVTLTCNQDKKTIKLCTRMAGVMAERHAREGIQEMNQYFDEKEV